ncbi:hypothetical protein SAMN05428642_102195 [Flaviramulus basaltis]|uniref:Lipocalin-like domain-containing protein n=1 Tax=Flaviramulus basaltis TaxID=369401 RepID=A0A1K2IGU9_9FLAO|nr:hypothetical protein [Flaviramulus basaltis]SFZ91657.1 hypothetical protein SAMN05428642_102195 [Flaviramulus basaltis]
MIKIKFLLLLTTILLIAISCSNSDDTVVEISYSAEDLQKMHSNSSKSWRIDNFYDDYEQNILSDFNDCYKDDTFNFFKDTNIIETQLGDMPCVSIIGNQEIATITYNFYENTGEVFINVTRSETNGTNFKTLFFLLELEELSDTKMVFSSGEKGNYGKTLVFVSKKN